MSHPHAAVLFVNSYYTDRRMNDWDIENHREDIEKHRESAWRLPLRHQASSLCFTKAPSASSVALCGSLWFSVSQSLILPRLRIIINRFEIQEDEKMTFLNALLIMDSYLLYFIFLLWENIFQSKLYIRSIQFDIFLHEHDILRFQYYILLIKINILSS
jgi:hypothetical protein